MKVLRNYDIKGWIHLEELVQAWESTHNELKDFLVKLEEAVSEYCGLKITFPLNNKGRMDAIVDFPVQIPKLREDIAIAILNPLAEILEKSFNKSEDIDVNIIHTITRDLSLSYIFKGYTEMSESQQYGIIKMVNELKNIGVKTYESQPVDIGVIYCTDDEMLVDIQKLDIDIILIPEKKSLNRFFSEEKPLLRLIDNKSLAVAIDSNFDVFAIVRKKSGAKSLSSMLESQYNEWTINDVRKKVSEGAAETIKRHISKLQLDDGVRKELNKYQATLAKSAERIQKKEPPKYIYFSIQNREINVYTNQQFMISYNNGDWKLRHYNLILATIMTLLFALVYHKAAFLKIKEFAKGTQ